MQLSDNNKRQRKTYKLNRGPGREVGIILELIWIRCRILANKEGIR